jgi:hypothetical protein
MLHVETSTQVKSREYVSRFIHPKVAIETVEAALQESDNYVRGQAESSADDIEMFTTYEVQRAT